VFSVGSRTATVEELFSLQRVVRKIEELVGEIGDRGLSQFCEVKTETD
jgi:hypothetical protein